MRSLRQGLRGTTPRLGSTTELSGPSIRLFQEGDLFSVAQLDHYYNRKLLGNDPRYQALLEEAGIIW